MAPTHAVSTFGLHRNAAAANTPYGESRGKSAFHWDKRAGNEGGGSSPAWMAGLLMRQRPENLLYCAHAPVEKQTAGDHQAAEKKEGDCDGAEGPAEVEIGRETSGEREKERV